jgi:hypothetical protein
VPRVAGEVDAGIEREDLPGRLGNSRHRVILADVDCFVKLKYIYRKLF